MALVVQPTSMNVSEVNVSNTATACTLSPSASTACTVTSTAAASDERIDVTQPQYVVCAPLKDDTASVTASVTASLTTKRPRPHGTATTTTSNKRPRKEKRSVQFLPDATDPARVATKTRTFHIDYQKSDCWWTDEQSREHMQRQSNLLQFYATNCPDLVDSVLLVWVRCAEEALADGNFCMTVEQRAEVALKVAQSPVRGFEKELAAELITEQRHKTIGGLMELQHLCQQKQDVTPQEQVDALAAASEAFSQTASIFAKAVAKADAMVASAYCSTIALVQ